MWSTLKRSRTLSPNRNTAALQPGVEEIAAFVDDSVFTQLSAKLGDAKEGNEGALEKKPLRIDEYLKKYRDAGLRVSQKEFKGYLEVKIGIVYEHPDVTFVPEDNPLITKPGEDEMIRLSDAFTKVTYVGKAQDDLAEYLRDCWKEYNPAKYKAPCVAVVQSSGFGKSRTVRELAIEAQKSALNMKVLYMCARVHESTGFPKATSELRGWLFQEGSKVEDIASRLKTIYVYANKHWADVQKEWLKLFTEQAADTSVKAKLSDETDTLEGDTSTEKNPNGRIVVLVIDEARSLLAEKGGKKNDFRMLRNALRSVNKNIGHRGCIFGVLIDTNSRISDRAPPLLLDPSSRLFDGELASFARVVLAETMDAHWDRYCEENPAGEDEETKEETQVAVGAEDEEKKKQQERAKIAMYKRIVTGDASQAWHALCRMGRPMWYSTCPNPADREDVINLAANKLLLGIPPSQNAYNKDTMFGVASMLCRLGVRPHSTSALASRSTADFMAILAYVNFKREGYVTSYASDPVLALGAMKVWYELKYGLAKYILPQLKNLLLDEALDTGGVGEIGEMVARILLLLAMDTCVMGDKSFSQCYHTIGQFVPVQQFLKVLQGKKKLPIYLERMISKENLRPEFNKWCSKWDGWYMGFTHFVQLQLEPNEDTLWFLLGRQAAGISPRNQYGADLLIPMFKKRSNSRPVGGETTRGEQEGHEVLMMLIQNSDGNSSAGKSTGEIGGDPKPLSSTDVRDTIRIYMNVRGRKSDGKFIYATTMKDNLKPKKKGNASEVKEESQTIGSQAKKRAKIESNPGVLSVSSVSEEDPVFTICLRLLNRATYPFLSDGVASMLSNMVESQYDPLGLVEGDLDYRDEDEKRNKDVSSYAKLSLTATRDKLLQSARKALAYAPGQKKTNHESDVGDTSEGVSKGDQGGETETSKKRARENQEGEEGRPTKRAK
ncbi:hypothetical protein PHYSODRAFT_342550 [Phytophthora sojae]|uniref:Uncharacterized protein n=1 Tax=Phytophthora sojae (strain P6497) TaxID=1094619 RepID=G5AGY5_PHYSP|nr:hypothetical protein PHYSODRAFT_342550 [Phytophthora sojae]EGZ05178.1 hypothetical protein PHYSODRAFT_342550 [Phytophthora sojae]|eukprot:XP_009539336.1 hypothetical protein PHYSODRAFT_342550 [Phytophthora sojae]